MIRTDWEARRRDGEPRHWSARARRLFPHACCPLALILALSGCYVSSAAYPVFDKGATKAMGGWSEGVFREAFRGDETFSFISVTADTQLPPGVCVQLTAAAPPMRIDELTPELASQWLERWSPSAAERASGFTDRLFPGMLSVVPSPEEAVFVGEGCVVSFDVGQERLGWIALGARSWWRAWATRSISVDRSGAAAGPRIGPASCAPLYALPVSRAQLIEVFGQADWEGWTRGEGIDAAANLLILF